MLAGVTRMPPNTHPGLKLPNPNPNPYCPNRNPNRNPNPPSLSLFPNPDSRWRMTISITVILVECTNNITWLIPIVMVVIVSKKVTLAGPNPNPKS